MPDKLDYMFTTYKLIQELELSQKALNFTLRTELVNFEDNS